MMKQYLILNCPCYSVTSPKEVEDYILKKIESKEGGYTAAINALKVIKYNEDQLTKQTIDNALIQTPDGVGAQLGFKILHKKKIIKLDLPGLILDMANTHKLKIFVLGTTEENNSDAVNEIKRTYPGINIVGRHNGFFNDVSDITQILEKVKPQIVMISMGSPKQEIISAEISKQLNDILFVGSGGRLDILAGKLKRAPNRVINLHLEWLYRLIKEPKRIKQQIGLIKFIHKLLIAKALNRRTSILHK